MDVLEIVGTVWTLEKVNIALRIHAPELVLLDWALAAVSASSVCSVAKSRLLAPKVVMVMPEADERHRRSASLAGADASVSRPTFAVDMETALALLFEARFRGPTGKA
jgi:DNA-binding response OmpR family regulator